MSDNTKGAATLNGSATGTNNTSASNLSSKTTTNNSDSDRSPSITSIASKGSANIVKWLYPSEVISDMESSEVPTDQSIQGKLNKLKKERFVRLKNCFVTFLSFKDHLLKTKASL